MIISGKHFLIGCSPFISASRHGKCGIFILLSSQDQAEVVASVFAVPPGSSSRVSNLGERCR